MNIAMHTPGPWNWYEHRKDDPENGPVKVETRDKVVAEIVWCGVGGHGTRLANAALIAQAPDLLTEREKLREINGELLKVLHGLLNECETREEFGEDEEEVIAMEKAKAAIEKAQAYNREQLKKARGIPA